MSQEIGIDNRFKEHLSQYGNFWKNKHRIEKFKELGIGKYQKNMQDIFGILLEYGNPNLAIRYAKRIIKDGEGKTPTEIAPGTKVYELVEELAKYLPEEVRVMFLTKNV